MRRLSVVLAVLAVSALPAFAVDVSGTYTVTGKNFDGSSYGGTASIVMTSENTCTIEWVSGPNTSQGICMVNENAFAAAYVQQGLTGLLIYEIKDGGVLDGVWTVANANGYGEEILTRQ